MNQLGIFARWCALVVAAGLCMMATSVPALGDEPTNFIIYLVDDLGWTDLGCYGSDLYETPNIDRLAREGIKFTNGYAACTVCSPTRASILTGKYPARLHLTDWIAGHVQPNARLKIPDWDMKLEHEEVTLAEALKPAGYSSAHVGKWHLSPPSDTEAPAYFPTTQGFELNIGGTRWGAPGSYFFPYRRGNGKFSMPVENLPPGGHPGEYLTDRLTDEAIKILKQWRSKPFFMYFAHYAVHAPIEGKAELVERYAKKLKPDMRHKNPTYAAMIQSVDESLGRIMATLDSLVLADRTVIIFLGDNGGFLGFGDNRVTTNVPLRAGKGSSYEGGVRVPFIIKWPGVTEAGRVCDEPVISTDFYPTILEIADAEGDAHHNAQVDGTSLVPILKNSNAALDRDALYWHYPHYHPGGATPYGAVRQGDWKLIEFYEDMHVELYNLKEDLSETKDRSSEMPDKVDALRRKLHHWRESVGAQMPKPNPNYKPAS